MFLIDYLKAGSKTCFLGVAIIFVVLIGYINHLSGMEISVSILYLLPVSVVSWFVGRREGGFIALACSASWYAADCLSGRYFSHTSIYYGNLAVTFAFFLVVNFAISEFRKTLERERELARVDSSTGVINSRHFSDLVGREIDRSRRYAHPLTLLYIDCDNFKNLNDRFGHQIGNRFLQFLATVLKKDTRTMDIVARLGGDEFAILMPETGKEFIPHAIQQLHARFIRTVSTMGWPVTLTMGAAIYLDPPASVEDLIKSADQLMLQAKSEGKNRVQYKVFGVSKKQGETILAVKSPLSFAPKSLPTYPPCSS
jgi:diguanylate cyclase (GGDEF)-like protein